MFLNLGIISCFIIIDENEGVVGMNLEGGISTGPSLEMVSNFLVGGIEIECWLKMVPVGENISYIYGI